MAKPKNKEQVQKTPTKTTKKVWYANWWGILIAIIFWPFFVVYYAWVKSKWPTWVKVVTTVTVSIFMLPIVIGVLNPPENSTKAPKTVKVVQQPEQKPPEVKVSLAQQVEKEHLKYWGKNELVEITVDPDMPEYPGVKYITRFEDISDGTVRVYVQNDITKEQAQSIGKTILGEVGFELKNLDWIVVRGTNGKDVNVMREEVPALR